MPDNPLDTDAARRASRAAQARWRRHREKLAREAAAAERPAPDPDQRRWRALAGAHWLDPRTFALGEDVDPDAAELFAKVRARAATLEATGLPTRVRIQRLEASLRRLGCLSAARDWLARREARGDIGGAR